MDKHSCPLRGLTLCDGQRVITDPSRPHSDEPCICDELALVDEHGERAMYLRWLRARTVARSPHLQRAMRYRQIVAERGEF